MSNHYLCDQAAVPKFLKLEMLPPTSTNIPPASNGAVTQEIRLTNSMHGQKNIMLKLKLSFTINGQNVSFIDNLKYTYMWS